MFRSVEAVGRSSFSPGGGWLVRAALVFAFLVPVGAALGETVWIPAAVGAPQEDVRLVVRNLEEHAAEVGVSLYGQPESDALPAAELHLGAGETITVDRALRELLHLEEAAGALRLDGEGRFLVTAERVLEHADGQRGMTLPALRSEMLGRKSEILDLPYLVQREGVKTTIWISLLESPAKADLYLFDAAGEQLLQRRFEAEGVLRLSLSDLLEKAPEICRAQLRIREGLAAVFAEMTVTGSEDRFGYAGRNLDAATRDQTFLPALRTSGEEGFLSTKVALFNPYATQIVVTLRLDTRRSSVTLSPFQILEIPDVLGARFGEESAAAPIRAVGSSAFFAVGINERRTAPEEPLSMAEARLFEETADTAEAENRLLLPPPRTEVGRGFLVIASEADEAVARFEVEDPYGFPAGPEQWLSVEPNSMKMARLDEVVPGATNPKSPLALQLFAGRVRAGLLDLLPGSNDLVWRDAEIPPAEPSLDCEPPVIHAFTASAYTLDEPGPVTLNWETSHAEEIYLDPEAEEIEANGSMTLDLEGSRGFLLRAENACGQSEAQFQVSIGLPALSGVAAGAPGEAREHGQPGELLALQFDNVAEPDLIEEVHVVTADGWSFPLRVLERGTGGEWYALVPMITERDDNRQVTGPVQLVPVFANGERGEPRAFRIDPSATTATRRRVPGSVDGIGAAIEQNPRDGDPRRGPAGMRPLPGVFSTICGTW
ncbi:MAG: hypothetical protein IPM24_00280 [Bryobacterales bacterium]|nr:hypothetical protein [Bryobacterales bacterium]